MARQVDKPTIFAAALLVAIGGLIYELLLGTASSYLFGDSITSFSLSIGTMLFGMGIGALVSTRLLKDAARNFVLVEFLLSIVGGSAVIVLFAAFAYTKIYWLVFVLLSIGIGVLIGLEIPLMVRIARKSKGNLEHVLSRVLALDYLGALIASIIFPFILLPYVGLIRTSLFMALVNVGLALYIAGRIPLGKNGRLLRAGMVAIIVVLLAGIFYANVIEKRMQTAQFKDPVVYFKVTPYQRIAITNYRQDTRLFLNDQLQFSSIDEQRYHETLTHAAMTTSARAEKVLILGGGDGLIAREVLRYKDVKSVTLVDIDKTMTDLGRNNRLLSELNNGSLQNPKVKIVNTDAFTYLRETKDAYDVIIADLVDPSNDKVAKLYSDAFYQYAQQSLAPGGVFITQATSSFFTPNAHQLIKQTVKAVGGDRDVTSLGVNVPSFGEWSFVMSSSPSSQLFKTRPVAPGVSYVSADRLTNAITLPPDFKPTIASTQISSLLSPSIYTIYNRDMAQWRYE